MGLDLDFVGKEIGPVEFEYDHDRVILYALGVGEGVEKLDFVYEKNLKVIPSFGVIPIIPCIGPLIRKVNVNFKTMLHVEQKMVFHRKIPTTGRILTTGMVESIYDKGDRGALINLKMESKDSEGTPLFENILVLLDRSAGNFGGDPGPPSSKVTPPEGKAPDFRQEFPTSPKQALIYRLSGDKNPLHVDPDFAESAGFERPILMGLCTFGFSARAILHELCGSDPSRFKVFSARFSGIVFPGDTIITEGWKINDGRFAIRTTVQDGRIVMDNAVTEIQ